MNTIGIELEKGYKIPIFGIAFKKEDLRYCIFMLLYKVMIDAIYVSFSYTFGYYQHTVDFNLFNLIMSYFMLLVILAIIPKSLAKFSYIANNIILILTIIPMLNRYAFHNESSFYMLITLIAFIAQTLIISKLPNFKVPSIKGFYQVTMIVCVVLIVYTFSMLFIKNGFPSATALNYFDVYEVRESYQGFPMSNYIIQAMGNAILPCLIAISFVKRKYFKGMVAVMLQLLLFLYTGHKYFALMLPLLVVIILGIKSKYFYEIITGGIAAALPVSIALKPISLVPISVLFRMLFIPTQIKFFFYDFISTNPYLLFSEGMIGNLFGLTSPYDTSFVHIISDVYYNDPSSAANTGYLADGYVQMGIAGILIVALVFAIIVKFVDSVSNHVNCYIVCALLLPAFFSLNDIALLTSLLTGGVFATIIIVYAFNSEVECNKKNKILTVNQGETHGRNYSN